MSYSSTDVANECQISPLNESSDTFGDNTSYKLPNAIKALYTRRDTETVIVEQYLSEQ